MRHAIRRNQARPAGDLRGTRHATAQIERQAFTVSDYTLLNARVGYRFLANQADISAMAFNLLDVKHRQHPFGQLVGRRLMVLLTYKF
jgi:iron complex outermembrane receptor protein